MSGGRPSHDLWSDGFRKQRNEKGKVSAFCVVCQKTLHNTSAQRLNMHRNKCITKTTNNSEATSLPISVTPLIDIQGNNAPSTRKTKESSNSFASLSDLEGEEVDNPMEMGVEIDTDFVGDSDRTPSTPATSSRSSSCTRFTESRSASAASQSSLGSLGCLNKKQRTAQSTNSLSSFCDAMSVSEAKMGDLLLAKFFYGCNIPFSVVESVHFKTFCNFLRPAYKPPGRRVIGSCLLDEVHEKFCTSTTFKPTSVLLIDGWKNESNNTKNVAAMLHTANGEAMFLESWNLSGECETGEKLAEIVTFSKELAKSNFKTDVFAVVTDNAANMMKMGRISDLWHMTCNSHTGQLLAKDIVPKTLAARVLVVLKAFSGMSMPMLTIITYFWEWVALIEPIIG